MMCKRILAFFCVACVLLLMAACTKEKEPEKEDGITLSDEDSAFLEEVKDDITVITDENYVEYMSKFATDSASLAGSLFQMEGMIRYDEVEGAETFFLYRNYENDGEASELGVAVRYLPEKPNEGDWIKVTGILDIDEHDGHVHTYLDIVTLETPEDSGSATVK